jgi:hypothetical protein
MKPKTPLDLNRFAKALAEGRLLEMLEEDMRAEGLLDPDPPETEVDLPPRVVELGYWHQARFERSDRQLWVYKSTADQPQQLPYFDPDGYTDEELATKLKIFLTFA